MLHPVALACNNNRISLLILMIPIIMVIAAVLVQHHLKQLLPSCLNQYNHMLILMMHNPLVDLLLMKHVVKIWVCINKKQDVVLVWTWAGQVVEEAVIRMTMWHHHPIMDHPLLLVVVLVGPVEVGVGVNHDPQRGNDPLQHPEQEVKAISNITNNNIQELLPIIMVPIIMLMVVVVVVVTTMVVAIHRDIIMKNIINNNNHNFILIQEQANNKINNTITTILVPSTRTLQDSRGPFQVCLAVLLADIIIIIVHTRKKNLQTKNQKLHLSIIPSMIPMLPNFQNIIIISNNNGSKSGRVHHGMYSFLLLKYVTMNVLLGTILVPSLDRPLPSAGSTDRRVP
mmetsp:Transcript_9871/g.14496  ORF Transcript_9871/g.14496 Transcript_9871/m.14496 type:complete len:341 (+) Transcript_9871:965-1987(+)